MTAPIQGLTLERTACRACVIAIVCAAAALAHAAGDPIPPANDDCPNAQPLSVGTSVPGTTVSAYWDDAPPCPSRIRTTPGVWYRMLGDGTHLTAGVCDATVPMYVTVLCGDCEHPICRTGREVDCAVEDRVRWCSEPGREYLILVTASAANSTGDFTVSVSSDGTACDHENWCVAPPNDLCGNAQPIGIGETIAGDAWGSGWDDVPWCHEYHTPTPYGGVWYRVVGDGTTLDLTECGGYVEINLYCGGCDAPFCFGAPYYPCWGSPPSGVKWCSAPNTEYLVHVSGAPGPEEPFELTLTSDGMWCASPPDCTPAPPPPPNDECLDAIAIEGEGEFAFDSAGARDAPYGEEGDHDVWFCWTSGVDGEVTIDTCAGTLVDTGLYIYPGCQCYPKGRWAEAYPNATEPCGFQSSVTFTAEAGESYLIQVVTYYTVEGGPGTLRINSGIPTRPGFAQSFSRSWSYTPPGGWNAVNSTRPVGPDQRGFIVADDFTLASDAHIPYLPEQDPSLFWWGTYFDGEGPCQRNTPDDFRFIYYADDCGMPGGLLAGPFSQGEGTLTVTGPARTGGTLMESVPEYEYSAYHAPFLAAGGERYWLEITNSADGDCQWYWETTGWDNGLAYQDGRRTDRPDEYDETDLISSDMTLALGIDRMDQMFCYPGSPEDFCEHPEPLCFPPPVNDHFADSIPLTEGSVFFVTSGADTDGDPMRPHHLDTCVFPLVDNDVYHDIWYLHETPCTGDLRVSTCGSEFDTKVALYTDERPPSWEDVVICNDDACGPDPSLQSEVSLSVSEGERYQIRVGGYRGASGPGTLTLAYDPPSVAHLRHFAQLARCYTGTCDNAPCDPPLYDGPCCGASDFDVDGDVDSEDFVGLNSVLLGP